MAALARTVLVSYQAYPNSSDTGIQSNAAGASRVIRPFLGVRTWTAVT
jgi:hypothetical protein